MLDAIASVNICIAAFLVSAVKGAPDESASSSCRLTATALADRVPPARRVSHVLDRRVR
jgi:hypothetical protein